MTDKRFDTTPRQKTVQVRGHARKLRSGKIVPVSPHYRSRWILLKDQPNLDKYKRKRKNDILWHGTSDVYLEDIKRYGLIPSQEPGLGATASTAWTGPDTDQMGLVALTDHMPNAAGYALHTSILAEKGGSQVILMVDRTALSQEKMWLREGSGAPPAKEWDYPDVVPIETVVGYWHNAGKVKMGTDGRVYVDETLPPGRKMHRGWVFYSNPKYQGGIDP